MSLSAEPFVLGVVEAVSMGKPALRDRRRLPPKPFGGTMEELKVEAVKSCKYCGRTLPLSNFGPKRGHRMGVRNQCHECRRKGDAILRKNWKDCNLQTTLKRRNINSDTYSKWVVKQGNNCAICGRDRTTQNRRLAIDHDHKTGLLRGLLCTTCNTGLGCFRDSVELLNKAIRYLGLTYNRELKH